LKLPRETMTYVPRLLALAQVVQDPAQHGLSLAPIENSPHFEVVHIGKQLDLARVAELAGIDMDTVYGLNPGFNRWATPPDGPHTVLVPHATAESFKVRLRGLPESKYMTWNRHLIVAGDTLGAIALQYHTSVSTLQEINDLRGTNIRAGHSLIVPAPSLPADAYTLSTDAHGSNERIAGQGKKLIYTVRSGDSLWAIARRYDLTVRKLTRWNGISRNATLRLGQQLDVWLPTAEPDVAAATTTDTPGVVRYKITAGDSLWLIARRFGVSVKALCEWNNLNDSTVLRPGQTLDIRVDTLEQARI